MARLLLSAATQHFSDVSDDKNLWNLRKILILGPHTPEQINQVPWEEAGNSIFFISF